jgi:hypothetical protein
MTDLEPAGASFAAKAPSVLVRLFAIDVRSLAAFRIGLGLLLLADLAIRATDLQAHYSDSGVLPRELLASRYAGRCVWSLHMLSGSVLVQALLFVAAALAAMALTLGIRSRLAAFASWVLLVSLHVRNPLVNNGGDVLLRSLLFWGMFLPLDARWALRWRGSRLDQQRYLSVASAAILVQVAIVYGMAGYYKLHGAWNSPDALAQILRADCYAKPLAYVLVGYPGLLAWMGRATLWSELVMPWLVFSPIGTGPLRIAAIVWFAGFHLAIELTLTVGLFSYVCWLAWILFVPSNIWDRFVGTARVPESQTGVAERVAPRAAGQACRAALWGGMLSLVLAYVALWNLSHLPGTWMTGVMPRSWKSVADVLGLRQKWNLFQRPMNNDGWYVGLARLDDGRAIDLLRGGAPADWDSYRKPPAIYRRCRNHRWRKYYRGLLSESLAEYREPLCRYLADRWQQSHTGQNRIETVELQYMQEIGTDAQEEDRFQQRFLCTLVLQDDAGSDAAAETESAEPAASVRDEPEGGI